MDKRTALQLAIIHWQTISDIHAERRNCSSFARLKMGALQAMSATLAEHGLIPEEIDAACLLCHHSWALGECGDSSTYCNNCAMRGAWGVPDNQDAVCTREESIYSLVADMYDAARDDAESQEELAKVDEILGVRISDVINAMQARLAELD